MDAWGCIGNRKSQDYYVLIFVFNNPLTVPCIYLAKVISMSAHAREQARIVHTDEAEEESFTLTSLWYVSGRRNSYRMPVGFLTPCTGSNLLVWWWVTAWCGIMWEFIVGTCEMWSWCYIYMQSTPEWHYSRRKGCHGKDRGTLMSGSGVLERCEEWWGATRAR